MSQRQLYTLMKDSLPVIFDKAVKSFIVGKMMFDVILGDSLPKIHCHIVFNHDREYAVEIAGIQVGRLINKGLDSYCIAW